MLTKLKSVFMTSDLSPSLLENIRELTIFQNCQIDSPRSLWHSSKCRNDMIEHLKKVNYRVIFTKDKKLAYTLLRDNDTTLKVILIAGNLNKCQIQAYIYRNCLAIKKFIVGKDSLFEIK